MKLLSNRHTKSSRHSWLTIGLKLILGITIASNMCIGVLLYSNWQSSNQVKHRFEALLQTQSEMAGNLRNTIYLLQENYQKIPQFFKTDKVSQVQEWIRGHFKILAEQQLVGRDSYKSLFNRTARRDLANGQFVVQIKDGHLFVAWGDKSSDGSFNDTVNLLQLASDAHGEDLKTIRDQISVFEESAFNPELFDQKMNALNSYLADEAINSEKTRTEILYRVEEIGKKEEDLRTLQTEKQRNGIFIGILTIFINIIVLLTLTGIIVEKPLRKLTSVISEIQSGDSPMVPYLNRLDKIGILARSIADFKSAMTRLREEDYRKSLEKDIINEFIKNISNLISFQLQKSRELADNALKLSELSQLTEEQSDSVTTIAKHTASNSNSIALSTTNLQQTLTDIVGQIKLQHKLVSTISSETTQSKERVSELKEATDQIQGIIKSIKDITQKSKLLAINAQIEAARYGQRGAGFLVVANEMKDLSHQTEKAADDIVSRTQAIDYSSQHFVSTIFEIEEKMHNLTDISRKIDKAAENQTATTANIAENVTATSADSQDVSRSIGKVNQAAIETREMASKVLAFSDNISLALGDILTQTREKLQFLTGVDQAIAQVS